MVADHQGGRHQDAVSKALDREEETVRKMIAGIAASIDRGRRRGEAQTYPARPITFVVALPAGGGVDALARVLAEHMKTTLGQPIIIENMGGAGGTLSIARVVRSAPDGYTLGFGTLGQYVISGAVYTLPFDMLADLTPIALLPSVPYWMTARKTLPANNLLELVAWLKANQGLGLDRRHREPGALLRHVLPEGDRHELSVRAVSRRCAGVAGPRGRQYRSELRSGGQFARAMAQRQHQGLCGDGEDALVRGA